MNKCLLREKSYITMNTLNLVAVITGIISSVAVTVSVIVGIVPQFRHRAVRATVKMIEQHKAEYYKQ